MKATPQPDLPSSYEHDHVYPVHALDDTPTMRSILIEWTILFNDPLDANDFDHRYLNS
jgi:hypothetical protein